MDGQKHTPMPRFKGYKELAAFVEGVAKCELGANAQFNFIIERARELAEKARGEA